MVNSKITARAAARRVLVAARGQVDGFTAGPFDPVADSQPTSRQGRRLLWLDGLVSSISDSFVTSFVNPFALALGATAPQVGWLNALANLVSALALLPGARLVEQSGRRKRIVVLAGGVGARLPLLALAAAPLVFPAQGALIALVLLVALRAFFGQLSYPAWSALVADLVPANIRGRYFASRNIALAAAALLFTPLAGWAVNLIGLPNGYAAGFFGAGIIGFVATVIFGRIPEPAARQSHATDTEKGTIWRLLRDHPRFAAFTAVAFLWNLSLSIAAPFFSVHLVRNLNASPLQIGLVAAAYSVAAIPGQRFWGRRNDQRGAVAVMRVTGFLIPLVPLLWSLAPNPWYLLAVETFSGFVWAGYGLANFNLLLGLAPAAQRARFAALYQVAIFSASFIGPLLGSALVNTLNVRPLLWLSCAGRLLASLLFLVTLRGNRAESADE